MVTLIGKHGTLGIGNAVLAMGMVGVALIRIKSLHFIIFALHVVGYSIADTGIIYTTI